MQVWSPLALRPSTESAAQFGVSMLRHSLLGSIAILGWLREIFLGC
jgi:hypothetical protein